MLVIIKTNVSISGSVNPVNSIRISLSEQGTSFVHPQVVKEIIANTMIFFNWKIFNIEYAYAWLNKSV
jgi:hypothetical protein